MQKVEIPAAVARVGVGAFYRCGGLQGIEVDGSNSYYSSIDGVLFSKNGDTLVCFPAGRGGEYIVPAGVVEVARGAFEACEKLTSVTISAGLEYIDQGAFFDCSRLATVTLPAGLRAIGANAFRECSELASLNIPSTVEWIGKSAFYLDRKLHEVYWSADTKVDVSSKYGFIVGDSGAKLYVRKGLRYNLSFSRQFLGFDIVEGHYVAFVGADGSLLNEQLVRPGDRVRNPAPPERKGYRFEGWFEDGASAAYNFENPPADDLTLKARWSDDGTAKQAVTFLVKGDDGQPIGDATVAINSEHLKTNAAGQVTVQLSDGSYRFKARKAGYVPVQDARAEVHGASQEVDVTLRKLYLVTFTVQDQDNHPLTGVDITVGGWIYTTNADGKANVSLVNGEHGYKVYKASAEREAAGTVRVDATDKIEPVTLRVKKRAVTFVVTDAAGNPLEGVEVKEYVGAKKHLVGTTDADGKRMVQQEATRKKYEVSKAGYIAADQRIGATGDVQVAVQLKKAHKVTFEVRSKVGGPLLEAAIDVWPDWENLRQGLSYEVVRASGLYFYSVSVEGYMTQFFSLTLRDTDGDVTENVIIAEAHEVTFHIQDTEGQEVKDVELQLKDSRGREVKTDWWRYGVKEYIKLSKDTYTYTVSREGYEDAHGTVTVAGDAKVNVTLEFKKYAVTFVANGGNLASGRTIEEVKVVEGQTVARPSNPVRDGYDFVEWQRDGKAYDFSQPVRDNFELVAQWRKGSYKVTFIANGGKLASGETKEEVKVAAGGKVSRPADPSREGHDFVEWQKDGKAYDFSAPVEGSFVLVAQWVVKGTKPKPKSFTVTFNANGGKLASGETKKEAKVVEGQPVAQPADPTREGHDFVEWQRDGKAYDFSAPVEADFELVALWKARGVAPSPTMYTVTFIANGGKLASGETKEGVKVAAGGKVSRPADPSREGHDFVEWQKDGKAYDFSAPVEAGFELVA